MSHYLRFLTLAFLLCATTFAYAQPSHTAWNTILQKHVTSSGKVNYSALKQSPAALNAYLETLSKTPPQANWSKKESLAYWINAYNAFTIKLIVDNYPVSSITKLHDGKAWDVKWINIGKKVYSLNNIENDIIRPTFKEPRIHFAVNCAAQSCPTLMNRAWTAANLEASFEVQTRKFVNNTRFNKITDKGAQLSKIFEWYAGDFDDLKTFINKYSTTKIKTSSISYLDYNWGLNKQ